MEPILKAENLTKVFSRQGQEDFTATMLQPPPKVNQLMRKK